MIQELIQSLTPQEKETLRQKAGENPSSLYKMVIVMLDYPDISKEAIQKRFKINENTYFKNLSLAKDEIYEVIKLYMKNSYDDLLLANVLYRRGLDVQASKLRLKLESQYDKEGWWVILQEIYNLDMMVAYTRCDIKKMEQIRDKSIINADRLHAFIQVDREVVVQMATIEKSELKEKDFDTFEANMNKLLLRARKINHHIPIFNALHSLFVLYTRYKIDLLKAKAVIRNIHLHIGENLDHMIPYTVNAAWLNTMGFHVEFDTGEKPMQYFKKVEDAIGMHGLLYDAEALISFCSYYFWTGDRTSFDKRFDQFKKMPANKSLQYKLAYLRCLHAYLHDDPKAFNHAFNDFYADVPSREYNDYDLTLRYLEILILIRERNFSLASDKLEATVKFARRNFTSYRIAIEKEYWDMFKASIQRKTVKSPVGEVFRAKTFLYDELTMAK